jgi:hypothetical protein
MSSYEYRIDWVSDFIMRDSSTPVSVRSATDHANALATEEWELVSVSPGTNAQTYGGLFLTFRRASRRK